jgi:hypothetical protein
MIRPVGDASKATSKAAKAADAPTARYYQSISCALTAAVWLAAKQTAVPFQEQHKNSELQMQMWHETKQKRAGWVQRQQPW